VTPEDKVKVLDFGLAKAFAGDVTNGDPTHSPTLSRAATAQGVILGTAAYMSPEQARGQEVDKRADIWAFGCVLYELLTGKQAFHGDSVTEILAGVLRGEPDWASLPAATPTKVRDLLRRCLQKHKTLRMRDAGDARIEIDEAFSDQTAAVAAASRWSTRRAWLPWTLAGVLFVVSAALGDMMFFGAREPEGANTSRDAKITFEVATPNNLSGLLSISPDGKNIADSVLSDTGPYMLWVRSLEHQSPRFLPGTEGATQMFWSPDGRFIGFFAGGQLKKVDISGVSLQSLCDASSLGMGGTWNEGGVIVFAPTLNGPLFSVPASGGTPVQVTELDRSHQELSHRYPVFLPDGRHFLYTAISAKADERQVVYAGSLDTKDRKRLINSVTKAVFAPPNHVLFARDGILIAQRFDPRRLDLTGDPFPVAEGIGPNPGSSTAFAASYTGVVAYKSGAIPGVVVGRLEWLDRAGRKLAQVGPPATYWAPTLSPDVKRVAVHREEGARDLWIFDLGRGTNSRLTSDAGTEDSPVWSPEGNRIVFSSSRAGHNDLYMKSSAGTGQEELLLASDYDKVPDDWSRDGRFLLYTQSDPNTGQDIWVMPMTGDRKPQPVIQTPFPERMAKFSPDGRWIAYASGESGRFEVYVQSFPVSERKLTISTNGGVQPVWRGDGRELFFLSLTGEAMAVPLVLAKDGGLEAGAPQKLFTAIPTIVVGARNAWSVTPDGQKFLIVNAVGETNVGPITVIVNWAAGLGR
jgi:Tol biopolymer transport system component